MRLALAALVLSATSAIADPAAYALAIGPSAYCGLSIDMTKAGAYAQSRALDQTEIGTLVWAEQQKAATIQGAAKAEYCAKVKRAAKAIGVLK